MMDDIFHNIVMLKIYRDCTLLQDIKKENKDQK